MSLMHQLIKSKAAATNGQMHLPAAELQAHSNPGPGFMIQGSGFETQGPAPHYPRFFVVSHKSANSRKTYQLY